MGSVKLKLRESHILTDGAHPISIRVIVDRKTSFTNIGVRCRLIDWNKETNLPKNRRLAIICQKKLLEVEEILLEGIEKGWSAKKVLDIFTGKDNKDYFLFDYYSRIKLDNKLGQNTILLDKSKLNKFRKYLKGEDISLDNITYKLLRDYKTSLEDEGLKSATRYLSIIRQVYNYAIEVDEFNPKKNPFKSSLFKKKINTYNTQQRNLNIEQTKKMLFYEQEVHKWKITYKTMAIDFWRFCFYMRGINFVEMALMKKNEVEGDYFNFTREKLKSRTNQKQNVRIFEEARDIINKYIDNDTPYVFPLLDDGFDKETSVKHYKSYNYKLGTINANLRRIGLELDLPFNLTTMSARYTFINIAKQCEVPFLYLQELIGHKTMSTTDIYLDVFPQKKNRSFS
jgi:site-specific recombinase XerD